MGALMPVSPKLVRAPVAGSIRYKGELLTPKEAPPLAASLRTRPRKYPKPGFCTGLTPYSPTTEAQDEATVSEPRVIWYEDSRMMAVHRELVRAGMERARLQGKRIGRPRVTERPEFVDHYQTALTQIRAGTLSHRKAAKQLDIGYATLKRLMEASEQSPPPVPAWGAVVIENTCGTVVD